MVELMSPVFKESGMIPVKYTCDSRNVSPPLEWESVPEKTLSLALICDDPDAPMGTWVHWVIFNIPATVSQLPEAVAPEKILADGSRQGMNDFRKIGYGGPCPPGGTHRYYFKIYALDVKIDLEPGIGKGELLQAMSGHILAEGQLMGRFRRQ